jgi:hypothetical protein
MRPLPLFKIEIDSRKKETFETQVMTVIKTIITQNVSDLETILPSIEALSEYNNIPSTVIEQVYLKLTEEKYLSVLGDDFKIDKIKLNEGIFSLKNSPLEVITNSGLEARFEVLKIQKKVRLDKALIIKYNLAQEIKYILIKTLYFAGDFPLLVAETYLNERLYGSINFDLDLESDIYEILKSYPQQEVSVKNILTVSCPPQDILIALNTVKDTALIQNNLLKFDSDDQIISIQKMFVSPKYVYKNSITFEDPNNIK